MYNPTVFENSYLWLQRQVAKLGYNFEVRSVKPDSFPPYVEPAFLTLLNKWRDATMTPWSALHTSFRAAQYVARNKVPGAIVECGVWRGGCSLLMAEAVLACGGPSHDFFLYDTFAGMSEPTAEDTSDGGHASGFFAKSKRTDEYVDWCYASIDEVRANIARSAYPQEKFTLVKGKVEDTMPGTLPGQIALLRLDTDWYESTRHEMTHLFPLLVSGGVFICDDYTRWGGAQKAVDEYLATLDEPFLLTVDAGSGRAIGVRR